MKAGDLFLRNVPIMLLITHLLGPLAFAQNGTKEGPKATAPSVAVLDLQHVANSLGEDPGPVYGQMIRQWVEVTNFAQNAASMATNKLKSDMEHDPKLQKIMSPALFADLEQFFYELFVSQETIGLLSRVYAQYFTLDEMQDILKFYKTDVGQKLIKSNPEIMHKSQVIGLFLLKRHEKKYMEVVAKYITPDQNNRKKIK